MQASGLTLLLTSRNIYSILWNNRNNSNSDYGGHNPRSRAPRRPQRQRRRLWASVAHGRQQMRRLKLSHQRRGQKVEDCQVPSPSLSWGSLGTSWADLSGAPGPQGDGPRGAQRVNSLTRNHTAPLRLAEGFEARSDSEAGTLLRGRASEDAPHARERGESSVGSIGEGPRCVACGAWSLESDLRSHPR